MTLASISDAEKRELARRVGADLTARDGKKKFYSPAEVGASLRRLDERYDIHCWAYCFFSTPGDFDAYHRSIGEVCDYASMKAGMLSAITEGASDSWFDVDLSWLEWPDLDFSGFFDFLDWP